MPLLVTCTCNATKFIKYSYAPCSPTRPIKANLYHDSNANPLLGGPEAGEQPLQGCSAWHDHRKPRAVGPLHSKTNQLPRRIGLASLRMYTDCPDPCGPPRISCSTKVVSSNAPSVLSPTLQFGLGSYRLEK